ILLPGSSTLPTVQCLYPSLPIPPLASNQCPPSLSANPSTGPPICVLTPLSANPSTGLYSVSSTPLCQSPHWPPINVLHPSLPIPPLASNHVLHPSLPIPPLASNLCPPPLSANPSTGSH
ncbi:unnamed protein product, partial [Staurois parvus]